jgi:hypothetical protein
MLNFVIQGLYDITILQITTNEFCIAKMHLCMCGVIIPKQTFTNRNRLQKLVKTPFSFLHYKIALKFKLL